MRDLQSCSTDDLINELSVGRLTDKGLLQPQVYKFAIACLPVPCVDVIPVRKTRGEYQIGVILRATGPEKDKLALIGGRIYRNESIEEAIHRHLKTDLSIDRFSFYGSSDVQTPFMARQYFEEKLSKEKFGFDPTKHSIALNYLITIEEEPVPHNEASSFLWITETGLKKQVVGYHQDIVMIQAFAYLVSSTV